MQDTMTDKGHIGMGMEGRVAHWYAATTSKAMDDYLHLASWMSRLLPQGGDILEVAPGPGYAAVELARRGAYRVTGLDISRTFVEIARENASRAGVSVDFRHGNASQMPFAEASFDLLYCRAAFKNFAAPKAALDEMHRVLRPGGRALILDLNKKAEWSDITHEVDRMHLSVWNAWFTRFTFRFMLLRRAYTRESMARLVQQSRFGTADIREKGIGLEIWLERK